MNLPIAIIFANIKGNIGDFAILHAMLVDLHKHHPQRSLHVFSHSSLSTDQVRWDAFLSTDVPPFTLCGSVFSKGMSLPLKVLSYSGLWPLIRNMLKGKLDREAAGDAKRFAGYEAIFVAGGHQWNGFKGLSMFATLRAIHSYNKSIHAYPFSVNRRIKSFSAARDLGKSFEYLCTPLVVRDSNSQSVLESLSLRTILGADCVYTLNKVAEGVPARKDADASRILLVMTGNARVLEKQLRSLASRLRDGAPKLTLLTTCELEDGILFRQLSDEIGFEYCAPLTWQQAVSEMKSSSLVVSNRLHGLILASFSGVPVLPVADRGKVASFVSDVSVPFSVPSLDNISDELLLEIFQEKHRIFEKIASYQEMTGKIPTTPITWPTARE